jgi:hypothetical protein
VKDASSGHEESGMGRIVHLGNDEALDVTTLIRNIKSGTGLSHGELLNKSEER